MSPFASKLAIYLSWITALILILVPFHAFLTVSFSSLVGHYTGLRLWKEFLLLFLVSGALYLLVTDATLRKRIVSSLVAQLIALYIFISFIWGAVAYALDNVTLKALGFGIIVNLRFFFFFLAVWIIAAKSPILKRLWPKLLLMPAAVVVAIGLLQRMVLPYDFLKHFGYSASTIEPYETINHNISYPRIMSTLRGANPLGAYLVLILTALGTLLIKAKQRSWLLYTFAAFSILAMFFTHSRSAWLGTALSLLILGLISFKKEQIKRIVLPTLVLILIVGGVLAWTHRHNPTFENLFFHTQTNSAIKVTSDQGHIAAFKSGLHDLINEPLGRGVGTAGPASVYNNNARIAENYYLQIAQETGWIGIILFIVINYLVACELWRRRKNNLALILLASLAGITFINMLSHAWTDDTLSYIWWGLAGIALAPILTNRKNANGKTHKTKS